MLGAATELARQWCAAVASEVATFTHLKAVSGARRRTLVRIQSGGGRANPKGVPAAPATAGAALGKTTEEVGTPTAPA